MTKELIFYRYRIPLNAPFQSAKGLIDHRHGLILGDGNAFWSEIAPLPGFSRESIDDIHTFLNRYNKEMYHHFQNQTLDKFLDKAKPKDALAGMPSIRFGISMLAEQQKAMTAGLSLYRYWLNHKPLRIQNRPDPFSDSGRQQHKGHHLDTKASGPGPPKTIRCNAIIGIAAISDVLSKIRELKRIGFNTIKLKLPPAVEEAVALIDTVCSRFRDLRFRFDANGSFSLEDAELMLSTLASRFDTENYAHPVDYIEEPLKNPVSNDLAHLKKYGIPLAADESARTPERIHDLVNQHAVDAIVLKPTLYGSFQEIREIGRIIYHSGDTHTIPVILSSAFETAVGRTLLAHLAAFFNHYHETDHGLATDDMLHPDIPVFSGPLSDPGPENRDDVRDNIRYDTEDNSGDDAADNVTDDAGDNTEDKTTDNTEKNVADDAGTDQTAPANIVSGATIQLSDRAGIGIRPDFSGRSPDPEAIFLADGQSAVTYRHLAELQRAARGYFGSYSRKKQTVAIDTGDRFEAILWIICCWTEGIPFVPFQAGYLEPLARFRPDRIILTSAETRDDLDKSSESKTDTAQYATADDRNIIRLTDLEHHRHGQSLFSSAVNRSGDLFCGLLTSGSTGKPKKVPLIRRQMLAAANNAFRHDPVSVINNPIDLFYVSSDHNQPRFSKQNREHTTGRNTALWGNCLPLHHAGGLAIIFRAYLSGTGVFLWDRFDAGRILTDLVRVPDIRRISLVPTMLHRLIKQSTEAKMPIPDSLQELLVGGGPDSARLINKSRDLGLPAIFSYGMTETCGQIAAQNREGSSPPASVGQLFPDHHISIRTTKGNNEAPTGITGLLWVKGPQIFEGYIPDSLYMADILERGHSDSNMFANQDFNAADNPENTTPANPDTSKRDNPGHIRTNLLNQNSFSGEWFQTGDYARLDTNGNLYIDPGRTDIIITGGENVSAVEVETALMECPGVADAGVTGIPDEEWGERLVALVVADISALPEPYSGIDKKHALEKSVTDKLGARLKPYQIPRDYLIVDRIPRTDLGKIRRQKLRETATILLSGK